MASPYTPVFTITLNHSYFADNLGFPLKLMPDYACMDLLNRYKMVFRPFGKGAGGTVYCNNLTLLQRFNLPDGLSFNVTCDDIALLNYTQIDTTSLSNGGSGPALSSSLFYCDNLGSSTATEPQTTPSVTDTVLLQPAFGHSALQTQPKQFLYVFDTPVTSARLTVTDTLYNDVVWSTMTPDQPIPSCLITLTDLPDGRYQLQIDGTLAETFYALDRPNASPWGKITIYPGGPAQVPSLAKTGTQTTTLSATGEVTPIHYQMVLTHRQTIWRYKIFSQQGTYGSDWQINASTTKSASANPEFNTGNTNFSFSYVPGSTEQPWVYQSALMSAGVLSGEQLNLLQTPKGMNFILTPLAATHANGTSIRAATASINLPYAQGELLVLPDTDVSTIT